MKWILIASVGIMIVACSSKKSEAELLKEFRRQSAQAYCECVFADTTRFVDSDSCGAEVNKKMERVKKENAEYASLNTPEFEYFNEPEVEKVCPGLKELSKRQLEKLESKVREMAKEQSELEPVFGGDFGGTLLSWQKLREGE
ncbi:MAG TPA: hypothetical protein VHM26_05810, partial [Chitinophagaceae bacterium]|nr:hypothetical protein [Chitinophagaceae bacterium]